MKILPICSNSVKTLVLILVSMIVAHTAPGQLRPLPLDPTSVQVAPPAKDRFAGMFRRHEPSGERLTTNLPSKVTWQPVPVYRQRFFAPSQEPLLKDAITFKVQKDLVQPPMPAPGLALQVTKETSSFKIAAAPPPAHPLVRRTPTRCTTTGCCR